MVIEANCPSAYFGDPKFSRVRVRRRVKTRLSQHRHGGCDISLVRRLPASGSTDLALKAPARLGTMGSARRRVESSALAVA